MADLLQRPLMIFVRPMYTSDEGHLTIHKGAIKAEVQRGTVTLSTFAHTGTVTANSPVTLNGSGEYSADPWFLHTVSTSYEHMRIKLKKLIATYGTDNVRVAQYIPIDYEVLPNQ